MLLPLCFLSTLSYRRRRGGFARRSAFSPLRTSQRIRVRFAARAARSKERVRADTTSATTRRETWPARPVKRPPQRSPPSTATSKTTFAPKRCNDVITCSWRAAQSLPLFAYPFVSTELRLASHTTWPAVYSIRTGQTLYTSCTNRAIAGFVSYQRHAAKRKLLARHHLAACTHKLY